VTTVDEINEEGAEGFRAVWELDPAGRRVPGRLPEAVVVESSPSFIPHGELLFLATASDAVGETSAMRMLVAAGRRRS
jgi:hypothetical protein